jgi:hypothetical protein
MATLSFRSLRGEQLQLLSRFREGDPLAGAFGGNARR